MADLTTSANVDSLLQAADYAAMRVLLNFENGADVTDATNVDAAGATMNADTDVSSNAWVVDEDTMSSNLATHVPTQQSVKAYVDTLKTLTLTSGEAISAGEWVYLKSDGKFWLTDASAEATAFGWVGVSLTTTGGADEAMTAQRRGPWTTSGLTAGSEYFLSETAGAITTTQPTAANSVVRKVGEATSTTVLDIEISYPPVTNDLGAVELNTQTGTSYTLVIGDASKVVEMNNGSANTLTIPLNASVAFPTGVTLDVVQIGAGLTTVRAASGGSINGTVEQGGGESDVDSQGQWKGLSLYKRDTDAWAVLGGA